MSKATQDVVGAQSRAPTSVAVEHAARGVEDPLVACLGLVARLFGKPFLQTAALAHLPLGADGALTADLFPRAAAALGIEARLVLRRPSRVSALLFPFIALLQSGDVCVVTGRSRGGRRLHVIFPAVSESAIRKVAPADLDAQSTGQVILLTPTEPSIEADAGRRAGKRGWFWPDVIDLWPSWLQIVLSAMIINLLGLAFPIFVMNVYDRVIPNLAIPTLWALTAGVLIALTFEFLLRQLRAVVLDQTGRRIDMRVGSRLFEHSLAITMAARSEATGTLANRLREFDSVRDFFTSSSILAVTDFLFIGIFIWVLLAIVGPIAYVPLAAVVLVIVLTVLVQIPLARAVRLAQGHAARRHSILIESLTGIETIKSVGAEGIMQRRWEDAIAATAKSNSMVRLWSAVALHLTGSVQQAVGIIIIVWGVYLVAGGAITIGGLIAASLLTGRILAPLGNIAMTLARAQQAFTAMRDITDLTRLEREQPGAFGTGQHITRGGVEFRQVRFTYPGSTMAAVDGVSFRLEPGQRLGIVGRVGSGKTTVGKLLCGLYHADEGSILIDGAEVRSYPHSALRLGVGYLGQDPELFAGTLRDNITLGRPAASEADILEAVRLSGVERFAAPHPLGLSQPVGERGRGLSGGQRQAVALARILLRQPKILFLDEPSSAMDMNTEAELIRLLRDWLQNGTTLIACTHRLPLLDLVDSLLVLDGGKVVAEGPKSQIIDALRAPKLSPVAAVPR